MRDGVCRHVVFPSYDGFFKWLHGSEEFHTDFRTQLNKQASAQRRNTAIDADGDWFPTVFKDADTRLKQICSDGHDNAGGLVVCRDKPHAEQIAKVIQRLTGKQPLLITSDVDGASEKIEQFARQQGQAADRWIVAIKMVSEGVDIKRLRVALYATNITTEMYFRQFVGRAIRVIGNFDDETAYVYVYPDAEILTFIQRIKEERDHTIRFVDELEKKSSEGSKNSTESLEPEQMKFFIPMESTGQESDHFWDHKRFELGGILKVRDLATELGIPEVKLVTIVNKLKAQSNLLEDWSASNSAEEAPSPPSVISNTSSDRQTKTERIKEKRKACQKLASRVAYISNCESVEIHTAWMREAGKRPTVESDFDAKLEWLKKLVSNGGYRNER